MSQEKSIQRVKSNTEELALIRKCLTNVREEMQDNPYILEAQRVLPAEGYRSAIGAYWNAVVDDLRKKIIHRSLDLFNKEIKPRKEIKTYEDFQDYITDIELIEGAYKIGVIGWEGRKILNHAREIRHIFDGHPSSSDPSPLKVLDMMNDCNIYALSQEYPPQIIDIDSYISTMDSPEFNRNDVAIEQALGDLPPIYKSELTHRFYSIYTHPDSSTILKSNIELAAPILWGVLPKEDKIQVARRLDKDIVDGNKLIIEKGTEFLAMVNGFKYVSTSSRRAIFEPTIKSLEDALDDWQTEGKTVKFLQRLGTNIPSDLIERYVSALTLTYVGYKGRSMYFARTAFYSDAAAPVIARLFELFDDTAVSAFIKTVSQNSVLKAKIQEPGQLRRLRNLANILLDRPKLRSDLKEFLELLVDEEKTKEFFHKIHT